ncbi:hypothetical protein TYRP_012603 [Tyrophagus putrescentiae]|nr:hypothetical protein TYRP_012603 [Tyrophagus putrescentiae]
MFASADGTHSSLRPRQTRGPRLSSFWLPTFNTTLLSSVHFNSTRLDSTTLHPLTLDSSFPAPANCEHSKIAQNGNRGESNE